MLKGNFSKLRSKISFFKRFQQFALDNRQSLNQLQQYALDNRQSLNQLQQYALENLEDLANRLKILENVNKYRFPSSCQIPNLSFIIQLCFGQIEGHLVEIGAFNGRDFSNTSGLIESGWSADLYEPIPDFFEACRLAYEQFSDVQVYNEAVSNQVGKINLYVAGALTTASTDLLSIYRVTPWARNHVTSQKFIANSVDLSTVFQRAKKKIDLLVVDTEGHEPSIFLNFQQMPYFPRMLILELADAHPDLAKVASDDFELGLKLNSLGYYTLYKDSINTVFLLVE